MSPLVRFLSLSWTLPFIILVSAQADPDACFAAPCPVSFIEMGVQTVTMNIFTGPDASGSCAYTGGGFVGTCTYSFTSLSLVGAPGENGNRFSCPLQGIKKPDDCDVTSTSTTSTSITSVSDTSTSMAFTSSMTTPGTSLSASLTTSANPSATSTPSLLDKCNQRKPFLDKFCSNIDFVNDKASIYGGFLCGSGLFTGPFGESKLSALGNILSFVQNKVSGNSQSEQDLAQLKQSVLLTMGLAFDAFSFATRTIAAGIFQTIVPGGAVLCRIKQAIEIIDTGCKADSLLTRAGCSIFASRRLLSRVVSTIEKPSHIMTSAKRESGLVTRVENECTRFLSDWIPAELCNIELPQIDCSYTVADLVEISIPETQAQQIVDNCEGIQEIRVAFSRMCAVRAAVELFTPFCDDSPYYSPNSTIPEKPLPVLDSPKWKYLGCTSSPEANLNFTPIPFFAAIDVRDCLSACESSPDYEYAALSSGSCYCSKSLTPTPKFQPDDSLCSFPCAKDPLQSCGGPSLADIPAAFSIYQKKTPDMTPAVSPSNSTVPNTDTFVTVVTVICVDVCEVCEGGLTTVTSARTTTIFNCNAECARTTKPTIPMVTKTVACSVCGKGKSPSSIIVTVPATSHSNAQYTATSDLAGYTNVVAVPDTPESNTKPTKTSDLAEYTEVVAAPDTPQSTANLTTTSDLATFTGAATKHGSVLDTVGVILTVFMLAALVPF